MNGKKAKRFRAAARSIETKFPGTHKIQNVSSKVVSLHPHCTRKFYKEMKQGKRFVRFISDAQMKKLIESGQLPG